MKSITKSCKKNCEENCLNSQAASKKACLRWFALLALRSTSCALLRWQYMYLQNEYSLFAFLFVVVAIL